MSRPEDLQERVYALVLSRRIRDSLNRARQSGCSVYWGERRVVAVRCRKAVELWSAAGLYEVQCRLIGCGGQTEWRRISASQAVDTSDGVLEWRR